MKKMTLSLTSGLWTLCAAVLMFTAAAFSVQGTERYVTEEGAGDNTGLSWEHAADATQIQAFLDDASVDTVYLAAGTYTSASTADQAYTVSTPTAIFGGYDPAGTGVRNTSTYVTAFTPTASKKGIFGVAGSTQVIFDGLTLKDISTTARECGAIYCGTAGAMLVSVNDCLFMNCVMGDGATIEGHATATHSLVVTNSRFYGSVANYGGVNLDGGSGSVVYKVENCVFGNCKAVSGTYGGIVSGRPVKTVVNTLFFNCSGGTGTHAGIISDLDQNRANTIVNCSFASCAIVRPSKASTVYSNCVSWNNNFGGTNITANRNNVIVTDASDGYFVAPTTYQGYNADSTAEFMLSDWRSAKGSLLVNSGNNDYIAGYSTDLAGDARIQGGTVDVGAYEYGESMLSVASETVNEGAALTVTLTLPSAAKADIPVTFTQSPAGAFTGETTATIAAGTTSASVTWTAVASGNMRTVTIGVEESAAFLPAKDVTAVILPVVEGTVRFVSVTGGAASTRDGLSWYSAYSADEIATAITALGSASGSNKQLWVAQGTYPRTATLLVNQSISVYGGFAGTEGALADRADTTGATTIFKRNGTAAFAMVQIGSANALFDGFTVDGVDSSIAGVTYGGGIHMNAATVTVSNCIVKNCGAQGGGGIMLQSNPNTVRNCAVLDCSATVRGGGIFTNTGNATIENCYIAGCASLGTGPENDRNGGGGGGIFFGGPSGVARNLVIENNYSTIGGGGIFIFGSSGFTLDSSIIRNNISTGTGGGIGSGSFASRSATINDCIIEGNDAAGNGGGVYIIGGSSSATLNRCVLANNNASTGAGHGEGGAFWSDQPAYINDCLIVCNTAARGAGIHIGNASSVVRNCTVVGNKHDGTSTKWGTEAAIRTKSTPNIQNCIVWGNSGPIGTEFSNGPNPIVSNTMSQSGTIFEGTVIPGTYTDVDPQFVGPIPAAPGRDADWRDYNFTLKPSSIAINRGFSATTSTLDLAGNARTQFGHVDMGAYETASKGNVIPTVADATFTYDGTPKVLSGSYDPSSVTLATVLTPESETLGGAYSQTYTVLGGDNWNDTSASAALTITPATITEITFSCAEGASFDPDEGNTITASVTADPVSTVPYTIYYYTMSGFMVSGFPQNAGNYYAKFVPNLTTSYVLAQGVADTVGFVVTGTAVPLIELSGRTVAYDDKAYVLTLTLESVAESDVTVAFDLDANWVNPTQTATIPAGTKSITVNLTPNDITGEQASTLTLATSSDYVALNEISLTIKEFTEAETPVRFVNAASTLPGRDGRSWETAYGAEELQQAIVEMKNDNKTTNIWVAQGTYPIANHVTSSDVGLCLYTNVEVYGGFLGTETALDQRADSSGVYTVLKRKTHAKYRMISFSSTTGNPINSVLDGLTIDGDGYFCASGGVGVGFYFNGKSTVRNCIIRNCHSSNNGGAGVLFARGQGVLENCIIENCSSTATSGAGGTGGGIRIQSDGTASYTIKDCTIRNCSAKTDGGGIYVNYPQTLDNCVIENCTAATGGGIYTATGATTTLLDVTVDSCRATVAGAGVYANAACTIKDCLFMKNEVNTGSGTNFTAVVHIQSGASTIDRCRFFSNKYTPITSWSRGLAVWSNAACTVSNSLFAHNEITKVYAETNAGIHGIVAFENDVQTAGTGIIYNCTFANNYIQSSIVHRPSRMFNCVIWNNNCGAIVSNTFSTQMFNNAGPAVVSEDGKKNTNILTFANNIAYNDPNGPMFARVTDLTQGYVDDPFVNDYTLMPKSLLVNRGDSTYYAGAWTATDLAGNDRVFKTNGNGVLDLGAYESSNKGLPRLTVTNTQYNFDGLPHAVTVTPDVAGVTLSAEPPAETYVGSYSQVYTSLENDNWLSATANGTLVIDPTEVTDVIFSCNDSEVFYLTNPENVITAQPVTEPAMTVPGAVYYYNVDGSDERTTFPTEVGDYYAEFKLADEVNYVMSGTHRVGFVVMVSASSTFVTMAAPSGTSLQPGGSVEIVLSLEEPLPRDLLVTFNLNSDFWVTSDPTCTIPAGELSNSVVLSAKSTATGSTTISLAASVDYAPANKIDVAITAMPIRFVTTTGGADVQDGLSWITAYAGTSGIQTALNALEGQAGAEVWVAQGTYIVPRSDGYHGLVMTDKVGLYGGFGGWESAREQRVDSTGVTTILKHAGDTPSHRVVSAQGTGANVTVDGFTIDGAGNNAVDNGGAVGIWWSGSTIRNCIVKNGVTSRASYAGQGGAGIFINASNCVIENVRVENCRLTGDKAGGAGILLYKDGSGHVIRNCVVVNNTSTNSETQGGGIYIGAANCKVEHTVIANNRVPGAGGAIDLRGTNNIISGCLIVNNSGGYGVLNVEVVSQVYNCTLVGNTSPNSNYTATAAIRINNAGSTIANCIVWGNAGGITRNNNNAQNIYNCISQPPGAGGGFAPASGVTNIDPQFVSKTLPTPGTNDSWFEYDYRLLTTSAAVNFGNNTYKQSEVDLDGSPRVVFDVIDAGCYEFHGTMFPAELADNSKVFYFNNSDNVNLGNDPNAPAGIGQLRTALEIIAAAHLDTPVIYLDKGLYVENVTVPAGVQIYGGFDFAAGKITLEARTPDVDQTVFSAANASSPILTVNGSAGAPVVLDNLVFTGATTNAVTAGGVVVQDCLFVENPLSKDNYALYLTGRATVVGSTFDHNGFKDGVPTNAGNAHALAVRVVTGEPINIDNCLVSNNYGSGCMVGGDDANAQVTNSIFRNNYSDNYGSALRWGATTALIENCLFVNNSSTRGGVIFPYSTNNLTIVGCSFINNGGERPVLDYNDNSKANKVYNCLFYNSGSLGTQIYDYCANTGTIPNGSNHIVAESFDFVNPSYTARGYDIDNADAIAAANWRILPSSPVVNAGNNAYATLDQTLGGDSRIVHGNVDIGVYESPAAWTQEMPAFVYVGNTLTLNGASLYGELTYTVSVTEASLTDSVVTFNAPYAGAVVITATFPAGGDYPSVTISKTILGGILAQPSPAADGYFVSADGSDDNDGSKENPFATIAKALEVAESGVGVTIYVSEGTYSPDPSTINAAFLITKSKVTLSGGWNSDFTTLGYETILRNSNPRESGNGARVVAIDGATDVTLEGFTVTGGNYAHEGGGIKVEATSTGAVIRDCKITGNVTDTTGGGVYLNAPAKLEHCYIIGNTATTDGGGIYVQAASTIENSMIADNTASSHSGGAFLAAASTINGCTITRNTAAGHGGGVNMNAAGSKILNSTISFNRTTGANGGGIVVLATNSVIENCIIVANSANANSSSDGNGNGGGIALNNNSDVVRISNCLIAHNEAHRYGAGVYSGSKANHSLYNCTIVNNATGANGGSESVRTGIQLCNVYNTVMWGNRRYGATPGNQGYDCSGTNDAYTTFHTGGGLTNVLTLTNADPGFVNASMEGGVAAWHEGLDYRLASTSLLIGRGTGTYVGFDVDLDSNPRVVFTRDIGAYESAYIGNAVVKITDATFPYLKGTTRTLTAVVEDPTGLTVTYSPVSFENAGTHVQTATATGSTDWAGSDTGTLTIEPATLAVVYTPVGGRGATFELNEPTNDVTFTYTATPTQDVTAAMQYLPVAGGAALTDFPTEVGNYYAVLVPDNPNNYTILQPDSLPISIVNSFDDLPTLTLSSDSPVSGGLPMVVTATLSKPATQNVTIVTLASEDWAGISTAAIPIGESSVSFTAYPKVVATEKVVTLSVSAAGANADIPLSVAVIPYNAGNIRYVTETGGPGQNGFTWETAYAANDLQAAIVELSAIATADNPCEVWVAKGTYNIQSASGDYGLQMYSYVSIYGGFAGTETAKDERDIRANETIVQRASGVTGCRVVTVPDAITNVVIDGLTVDGNNIDVPSNGGVIGVWGKNVTIRNCTVQNGLIASTYGGGGIYAHYDITIENTQVLNNKAPNGGGVNLAAGGSTIRNSIISNNVSTSNGGGVFAAQTATIENTRIIKNSATGSGGGIQFNGAGTASTPNIIRNCEIIANKAATTSVAAGGGICVGTSNAGTYYLNAYNTLIANNEITAGNSAWAGAVFVPDPNYANCFFYNCSIIANKTGGQSTRTGVQGITLYNSLLWGNGINAAVSANTATQGYRCNGSGNAYTSMTAGGKAPDVSSISRSVELSGTLLPGLINGPTTAGVAGWNENLDYRLLTNSRLVDKGTYGTTYGVDLDNYTRVVFGTVDVGAYELQLRWTQTLPETRVVGDKLTLTAEAAEDAVYYTADPAELVEINGNVVTFLAVTSTPITFTAHYGIDTGLSTVLPISKQVLEVTAGIDNYYFVSATTGDDNNSGRAVTSAKKTLNAALSVARAGDTIYVAVGEYASTGSGGQAYNINVGNMSLYGGWTADFTQRDPWANTTILKNTSTSKSRTISLRQPNGLVDGFTITGGVAEYEGGGIASVPAASNSIIRNCTIIGNTTPHGEGGGGVAINSNNVTFENCIVANNTITNASASGAGIRVRGVDGVKIINCLVVNNSCTGTTNASAAGIAGTASKDIQVINCTVAKNSVAMTDRVAGVRDVVMYNTVVWGNTGGANATPTQAYNVTGSRNATSSDVGTGRTALDDTVNSAGFINPASVAGTAGWSASNDWRPSATSVLINRTLTQVADIATDLDGNERTQHGYTDIGAYEAATPGVARFAVAPIKQVYDGQYVAVDTVTNVDGLTKDEFSGYRVNYSVSPFPRNAGAYIATLESKDARWICVDTGAITITKAPLQLVVEDVSSRYGAALPTPAYDYNGFIGTDTTTTVLTGEPLIIVRDTQVGVYPITVDTAPVSAVNYYIADVSAGNLTVTPALLTLTIDPKTKTYGALNPALTGTYSGFEYGENDSAISTPATITTSATQQSNVDKYLITADTAVFSAANYIVDTVKTDFLTINKATLTLAPNPNTLQVNVGQPLPDVATFTVTYSGLMTWDAENGEPKPGVLTGTPAVGYAADVNTSNVKTFPEGLIVVTTGVTSANYTFVVNAGSVTVVSADIGLELAAVEINESETAKVPFYIKANSPTEKIVTKFTVSTKPRLRQGEYTIGLEVPTTATLTFSGSQGTITTTGSDSINITVYVTDDRYARGDKEVAVILVSSQRENGERLIIAPGVATTVVTVKDIGNLRSAPYAMLPETAATSTILPNFAKLLIEQSVNPDDVESIEVESTTLYQGNAQIGDDGKSVVYEGSRTLSDMAFFTGYTDTFYLLARMKNGNAPIPVQAVVYVGDQQAKGTPISIPFAVVNEYADSVYAADRFTQTPFVYAEYYRPFETLPAGAQATPIKVMLKTIPVPVEGAEVATAMLNLSVNMTNSAAVKKANAEGVFTAEVIDDESVQKKFIGLSINCSGTESTTDGDAREYDVKAAAAQIYAPVVNGVTRWVDPITGNAYLRVEGSWFGSSPSAAIEYLAGGMVKSLSLSRATAAMTVVGPESEIADLTADDLTVDPGEAGVLWIKVPKNLPESERIDLIIKSGCGIGAAPEVKSLFLP